MIEDQQVLPVAASPDDAQDGAKSCTQTLNSHQATATATATAAASIRRAPARQFLQLAVLLVSIVSSSASQQTPPPPATTNALKTARTTDYIDCNDPCNGGDVNYELRANVRIMKLLNYTYKGRTYSQDGDDSFMGPTMHVKPGQSLWIKFRNDMYPDLLKDAPKNVTIDEYWKMLQNPGEQIKYQYYKPAVDSPSKMSVDTPNIPHNFDATNLHLHGLDVEVHMFDPVNTHHPKAPHIAIQPGECYCYRFNVPDHHPGGMYWYHPHLHGATALQMWGGMIGLLYVDGPLEQELVNYGVTQPPQEFVISDPALRQVQAKDHDLEVDTFLAGQTTLSKIHPFLVNGQDNPTYTTHVNQFLWLRVLCATTENENTFIVYPEGRENEPWDESAIPFWVIGSDGVTWSKPVQNHILVLPGGRRDEILLQFDQPGRYVISQQGIQGMQFFDMWGHPHDQILATIEVLPVPEGGQDMSPNVPIESMRFTPGYKEEETIRAEDIVKSENIVFSMGADRDKAPFPQYYVNGKAFHPDRLDFHAHPGEAVEYVLINANHNVHPFHIHVNRFQVQEMGSELSIERYPVLKHVMEFDPTVWRDTVIVPPNGRARIWVQYKNYTGKTVFHCHFLAHEDTGMMSTLFIGTPELLVWDYLEEHYQMLLGIGFGIVLAALLWKLVVVLTSSSSSGSSASYEPVVMNELKSKAMD